LNDDTLLRRCAFLRIEPKETLMFDPIRLLSGEDGLVPQIEWQAQAAHLFEAVPLSAAELAALDRISESAWKPRAQLASAVGAECLASLHAKGLVVARDETSADGRASSHERDQRVRDTHWHAGSAVAHAFSRWSHTDSVATQRESRLQSVDDMVEAFGPPPPHFHRREDAVARVSLDAPARTALDDLLERRATCRNFDMARPLPLADLATLLKRVYGVQGMEELAPGAIALKKNHPSGGGLHPVEAYLIAQRVEGLQPGLYHYNVEAHALDLLRAMPADEARALATVAVAGQEYFADAPVMIVMAARFARSMWKYRNHPKIYRAILLEMGHISQNVYLTATEMNLGAFITAAINEVEIEQAFALEPLSEGPLAVCGFGARAATKTTVEFDPAHKVWNNT
jgi:putative peptide maturation dehydrogenase